MFMSARSIGRMSLKVALVLHTGHSIFSQSHLLIQNQQSGGRTVELESQACETHFKK